MFNATIMPGELELIATSKLIQRPIIVYNSKRCAVLKYGMGEFSSSPPVILMVSRVGEDVGHYDCLLLRQQHVIAVPKNHLHILVKHITPILVHVKMQTKRKRKKKAPRY